MRIARQNIVAGAAGAALAAVAVVTVYEGKVLFANQHGQVELGAGDRAVASNDRAPRLAPEAAASLAPGSADGDATQLTVAELLERDRVQLARIAKLEAELEQFRDQAGARGQADTEAPPKPPCELTKDELVELARVCNLPFDMPPTAGSSIMDEILEEGFDKAHFTEAERAAVDRVITQFQPGYETSLRSLYRELTGESGEALDVTTLMFEIVQKSPRADIAAAKQVVARERAGLQAPPPNSNAGTVIERFFRLALRAGEDFEAALAELVPPDRAREFRRNWGEVRPGAGCPE